jgi:hypothetical protein
MTKKASANVLLIVVCLSVLPLLVGAVEAGQRRLSGPERVAPGGPLIAKMPDLIIKSIEMVDWPQSACTGPSQLNLIIRVTFQNAGTADAVLPPWKNWVKVWSILGGAAPPYVSEYGGPPGPQKLAPGKTAMFTTKLAVFAKASPDKKTSTVGIGAIVDPSHAIAELQEGNNYKEHQIKLGGVCP